MIFKCGTCCVQFLLFLHLVLNVCILWLVLCPEYGWLRLQIRYLQHRDLCCGAGTWHHTVCRHDHHSGKIHFALFLHISLGLDNTSWNSTVRDSDLALMQILNPDENAHRSAGVLGWLANMVFFSLLLCLQMLVLKLRSDPPTLIEPPNGPKRFSAHFHSVSSLLCRINYHSAATQGSCCVECCVFLAKAACWSLDQPVTVVLFLHSPILSIQALLPAFLFGFYSSWIHVWRETQPWGMLDC